MNKVFRRAISTIFILTALLSPLQATAIGGGSSFSGSKGSSIVGPNDLWKILSGSLTPTNNSWNITGPTIYGTTFDTNVAAAGMTIQGTTIATDGTDSNIDITLTPKGTGTIVGKKNFLADDGGSNTSSYKYVLEANNGGTIETSSLQGIYGADPYLRISAPNDSGVETAVMDIHDTAVVFATDNTVDIGASGANRPKDIYASGTLNGLAGVITGVNGLTIGTDVAGGSPNVAGTIKMYSVGDNAFYNTITSGTNTANATYTLPTAMPATTGSVLTSTDAGVMSWTSSPSLTSITTGKISPIADGTTAIQFMKQDGTTAVIDYDTTNQQLKFRQIGVNATGYADQRSSGILNFESSQWTGATEAKGNWTIQNIPSASANKAYLSIKYGATEFESWDSGAGVIGSVTRQQQISNTSTTTPAGIVIIRNSNSTVNNYEAIDAKNQGSMVVGKLAFKNTSHHATTGAADFSIWLANGGAATEYATLYGATNNFHIGDTDDDGTPATGRLVVKGSTNDGSTNIFVGRDSDTANVVTINTNGDMTTSGTLYSTNTSGVVLGEDKTTGSANTAGAMKLISTGDNAFYTTITAGTQTQNNAFTLPVDDGTNGQFLKTDGSGALSWGDAVGFAWGASISGTTTGGATITLSNGSDSGAIAESIVMGNTQSNALTGLNVDLGTSAQAHKAIQIVMGTSNNTASSYGLYFDSPLNGGTSGSKYGIWQNRISAGVGGTGYGIYQGDIGDNGTAYGLYQGNISTSNAGGLSYGWYVASIGSSVYGNNGKYFSLNNAQSGDLEVRTNDASEILFSRTHTGENSKTDNFNILNIKRTNIANNASATYNAQGSVLKLENVATNTSSTAFSDTVDLLKLTQDQDSTGWGINMTNGGILVSGTYGAYPTFTGGDQYFAYLPTKGALKGGTAAYSNGWNAANTGNYSIAWGQGNIANGSNSIALGMDTRAMAVCGVAIGNSSDTYLQSQFAQASYSLSFSGGNQFSRVVPYNKTTDATSTVLGLGSGKTNILIAENYAWTFVVVVTGRQSGGTQGTVGDTAGFEIHGVIKNTGGTTTLVGTPTITSWADAAAATWTATAVANNTNDSLDITVTGEADKTIGWTASVELTEVGTSNHN